MKIDKYCWSWWSQGWGLMFSFRRKNLVMEFASERKISLHMWCVFYPIDVLVLDSQKRVVEVKKNFRPWTFWKSSKKGKYVVELGRREKFQLGDRLRF